jgi:hypothetical protein
MKFHLTQRYNKWSQPIKHQADSNVESIHDKGAIGRIQMFMEKPEQHE